MKKNKIGLVIGVLAIAIAVFVGAVEVFAQPSPPPPPPGGGLPPCWPPPCIPLDQGTEFVVLGGILMAGAFLVRKMIKP